VQRDSAYGQQYSYNEPVLRNEMGILWQREPPVEMAYVNIDDDTCGGNAPCYTSIQDAINAASSDATVKISRHTYTDPIILNERKNVTLSGGWDSSFRSQTANKTFIKAPSAPKGSLTMQMLTITP
jgi:hypothetical protein